MKQKTKKWISTERWKSIKKWSLIAVLLVILVIIGNLFQKIAGGNRWIIFFLDFIFCGMLFVFIKFTINNDEKTFLKIRVIIIMAIAIIILVLLLVIIIAHSAVTSESFLERSNIIMFPIMLYITITKAIKGNRGNYDL